MRTHSRTFRRGVAYGLAVAAVTDLLSAFLLSKGAEVFVLSGLVSVVVGGVVMIVAWRTSDDNTRHP